MPNVNVSFQGQTLVVPGAYYADNVSAVSASTPATTPPLVFLGYGWGVKPQVPTTFNSAQDLLKALRGGPCSGFVPFLTSPSPQLFGAQQITYINVGENTQSTLALNSGTSGVIVLTSADYGLPSNQLQAQVQSASTSGKAITLFDGYSLNTFKGDNLGVPFQLAYTGSATGVTYSVTASGTNNAVTFTTTSPNSGESVTISLLPAAYGTIEKLVGYLNGTGFYSAQPLSSSGGGEPSANLDVVSGTVIAPPSGGVNQYIGVAATLTDPVYWVNTFANSLATAAISGTTVSSSGKALTNIPLTLFSGATSVPPTNSDYASGFNNALTVPGWTVFADSNASGVVALGTQHAITASNPLNGRWRRFFSGSSAGDSVSTASSAAMAQAALTTCYVYPGIYRVDPATGLNTLYDGLHAAAAAAGMATGNPIPTPLTNKALTGTGVEVKLTQSQINTLQTAGVMPIWISPQTGSPTIVSDITTWQADSNPENVFTQQVACRWFLAYSIVNATAPYVGTVAAPLNEARILNAVKATLNSLIYSATNVNGVISSWDPSTLQLTYTGSNQTAAISVNVTLVGQNRFITVFVPIQPLNINISVNSAVGTSVTA